MSSEDSNSNKYFKPFIKKNITQMENFVQISNDMLNVENIGMDNYCTFHQEDH